MDGPHATSGIEPGGERMDEAMAAVLASKTPAERIAIADGMWRSARSMIDRLVRSEHPEWSVDRVDREVARRLSHGAV